MICSGLKILFIVCNSADALTEHRYFHSCPEPCSNEVGLAYLFSICHI